MSKASVSGIPGEGAGWVKLSQAHHEGSAQASKSFGCGITGSDCDLIFVKVRGSVTASALNGKRPTIRVFIGTDSSQGWLAALNETEGEKAISGGALFARISGEHYVGFANTTAVGEQFCCVGVTYYAGAYSYDLTITAYGLKF